jgi:Reverse transcriptase (RNA-dependent DNA polymerase)
VDSYLIRTICSYLINRVFSLKLGNFISRKYQVNRGVPQGSVLGPLLFIIFFNKISSLFKKVNHLLFADDLAIYISGSNLETLTSDMNTILGEIDEWCTDNGLLINYAKTKYMIFQKTNRASSDSTPLLSVKGIAIERVDSFKYLGIIFDQNLNFKLHFEYIESKCHSAIGAINKLNRLINTRVLAQMINSYVISITDYCMPIWGWANTSKLDILQKNVNSLLIKFFYPHEAKFFYRKHWAKAAKDGDLKTERIKYFKAMKSINLSDLYERCGLFTFKERLILITATNVFNSLKFQTDIQALKDFFAIQNDRQLGVRTRSCTFNGLQTTKGNYSLINNSVKFASVKLWNQLPQYCKLLTLGNTTFKSNLHKYILELRQNMYC